MKHLLLCTFLAAGLSGCVSGHPSTDRSHSHVDTSSTRYDVYDPDYAYHDDTMPRNKRRLYEGFHRHKDGDAHVGPDADSYDDEDDYLLDYYYDDRDYYNMPSYYRYNRYDPYSVRPYRYRTY
jgi:hypothetical protein